MHWTNYLILRRFPFYSILHVWGRGKKKSPTIKFLCLTSCSSFKHFILRDAKMSCILLCLSFIWVTTMGNGGVGRPLFNILNLMCRGHTENELFNSCLITLYRLFLSVTAEWWTSWMVARDLSFPRSSTLALGPNQPPVNGYCGSVLRSKVA